MSNPAPARRRRLSTKVLAAAIALIVALVAAFPWYLGTAQARRWMLTRANRAMAPGRLEIASFRVSWFGPTRLTDFRLVDPQGDRVVSAPLAIWDRNLAQILFLRPKLGTLTLQKAAIDVERRRDGTLDLAETLGSILRDSDRETDLTVRVVEGTFRLRGPNLPEPVLADRFDLTIHRPPEPGAVDWSASLSRREGPRLAVEGTVSKTDSADARSLVATLRATRWPIAIDSAGVSIRAALDGTIDGRSKPGAWDVASDCKLLDVDLSGPALRGDRVREPSIGVRARVESAGGTWTVRDLGLTASVGSVRTRGVIPPSKGATGAIEGTLDLAAIARRIPRTLRIREGTTLDQGSAHLTLEIDPDNRTWDVEARISDLIARDRGRSFTLNDPATLSARLVGGPGNFELGRFQLRTPFLELAGSGDLDRGIDVAGNVDLSGLQRQFRELVDFRDLDLAGRGPLTLGYRRDPGGYSGKVDLDLAGVRVSGAGPATIRRDRVRFQAEARGAASPSGWPDSVASARIEATDGGDALVRLDLKPIQGGTDMALLARLPIPTDPPGRLEALVSGQLDASAFDLQSALLGLRPEDREKPPWLALSARGKYDRGSGDLAIDAIGEPTGAIALDSKGIRAKGIGRDGWSAEGGVVGDLASLSKAWSAARGGPVVDIQGGWSARVSLREGAEGVAMDARLLTSKLSLPDGDSRKVEAPISLAIRGDYRRVEDRVDLIGLDASGPHLALKASGRVDDPLGRRVADLKGTLAPDWRAINDLLAKNVEPEAKVAGSVRPFWLRGPIGGDALEFEAGLDLEEADLYGMTLGPTPIVVRKKAGKVTFDPIETTLNGGRLHLEPGFSDLGDRGSAIVLGPGSTIRDAEINDEVSRRVLSFAAPILEKATSARGLVSVAIRKAEFPIVKEAGRKAVVEGDIAFRDVEFVPGALAEDLFGLVGRQPKTIKLTKPVLLSISEGRVQTRGLAVPIGDLTEIALEGSVDFDRNLDLVASIPLTSAMVGGRPILGDIVSGTRVSVPIKGTLSAPRIDKDAFRLGMRDMGKDLLERGAVRGAMGLLDLITRPRDPNAPPPEPRLTPEERRARRLERRMERRGGNP